MPLVEKGVYVENSDKPYEFESAYYLDFQITSALFSIEHIINKPKGNDEYLKSQSQYCHFFCDHLIFSLGQIVNRFNIKNVDVGLIRERKEANIINFNFNKEKYPILSDNKIRNTVEHIDEHNQRVIKKYYGVGGFNIIDEATEEQIVKSLTTNRKMHPYTLDLTANTLYVMRNDNELKLNLNELKEELISLQKSVRDLLYFVSEKFWRNL